MIDDNEEGIPEFLRVQNRRPPTPEEQARIDAAMAKVQESDAERNRLRLEQIKRAKEKSRVRIEKLVAKQSGETAQMPTMGKTAMEIIMKPGPKETALRETRAGEHQEPKPKRQRKAKEIPLMRIPDEPPTEPAIPPDCDPIADQQPTTKKKARSTKPVQDKTDIRPGTKLASIVKLLSRPEGCTTADVLKATGWPSVSMPAQAKAAGLKLKKVKDGNAFRYRAA